MEEKNYNISVQFDKEEMEILMRAILFFRILSAMFYYSEYVETCEMIENKLKKDI